MELNSATESQLNNFLVYGFSVNSYVKSGTGTITAKRKQEDRRRKIKVCEWHRWCCLTATGQNLQCLDLMDRFAICHRAAG